MRTTTRTLTSLAGASALAVALAGIGFAHPVHDGSGKEAGFDTVREEVSPGGVPQERMTNLRCKGGMAGIFPCHKVDLEAFVPLSEMGDSVWVNDVWGWSDPQTGRDYALVSLFEGTGFLDITQADNPVWLGMLPTQTPDDRGNIWGDIKVNDDHAYIVSEATDHGMQVFDLTRLRGVDRPQDWTSDAHVDGFGQAHNLAINEDSDTAYVVGAVHPQACNNGEGGPMAYDLSDPKNPQLVGCYGEDGYTHDVQCVEYHGPDADYTGREICVASNEDTVTIVDMTDPAHGKMLARAPYETASYTHQGWFTEDHAHFLLGDETDELEGTVDQTTTYVWDLTDLDAPELTGTASTGLGTIDHNIFIKDSVAYESNYTSGLRLFDTKKVDKGRMKQIGWFDGFPADDSTTFAGSWSNYPWFDDGKVIFTGVEEGLFVVDSRAKSSATNNGNRSTR